MKKLFFICIFNLVVFSSYCFAETVALKSGKSVEGKIEERADIANNPVTTIKQQPLFKTIKITYKLVGTPGAKNVYIDSALMRRRDEYSNNVLQQVTLFDKNKIVIYDSTFHKAIQNELPSDFVITKDKMDSSDYAKLGQEAIAGKKCDVYEYDNADFTRKLWRWNDLNLKETLTWKKQGGASTGEEAVSVEENIEIAPKEWELPRRAVLKTQEQAMADMDELEKTVRNPTVEDVRKVLEERGGDSPEKNSDGRDYLSAFLGDKTAEKRVIERINQREGRTSEQKEAEIKNFHEALAVQQKVMEQAKRSDGKTDLNKMISVLQQQSVQADDAIAKSTLHSLSEAAESFAKDHNGNYPQSADDLTRNEHPYLSVNYCGGEQGLFSYRCEFDKKGYQFTATPIRKGETGSDIFTAKTGRIFSFKEKS